MPRSFSASVFVQEMTGYCRLQRLSVATEPGAGAEAGLVVHVGQQVDPSVWELAHEGEEIGLPELVGSCPSASVIQRARCRAVVGQPWGCDPRLGRSHLHRGRLVPPSIAPTGSGTVLATRLPWATNRP